jgi:hypothetical protein
MGFTDFVSDAGLTRMSQLQLPALRSTDLWHSPGPLGHDPKLHRWVCNQYFLFFSSRPYDENNLVRVDEVD